MRDEVPSDARAMITILSVEGLAQDLEDMAAELGQFIQEEDAVVGQRHLARPRHVAPADLPDIGDGVMGGATRARGDHRGPRAGAAGATVEARRFDGFREGQVGQDGVRARAHMPVCTPGGAEAADVMVSTPAAA
jgi:hypothetical protein